MKVLCKTTFGIFLFSMGWMFGLYVEHWDVFHLSFDVPAFNIVNLLVISILAWNVNNAIQNKNRKNKSRMDLLSGKIDEVDDNLKRIIDLTFKDIGASYIEICSLDKRNRDWTATITNIVKKHYHKVCQDDLYKELMPNLHKIRELLSTPAIVIPGAPQHVTISENIVHYDSNRRAEIESLVNSSRKILYSIKVAVSQQ